MPKFLWATAAAFAAGFACPLAVDASEIPAFARRYKVSCQLCHNPFPSLTEFGDNFAANGWGRAPGAAEPEADRRSGLRLRIRRPALHPARQRRFLIDTTAGRGDRWSVRSTGSMGCVDPTPERTRRLMTLRLPTRDVDRPGPPGLA